MAVHLCHHLATCYRYQGHSCTLPMSLETKMKDMSSPQPHVALFLAMEYTAANLEQAVAQFYHTDAAMRAQAHRWLTAAQMSPEAWAFVWELLHSSQSPEVLFFAATTLHAKVVKCWHEIPADQYSSLKKHILQATVNYCMGPKIVVNKLCIAVSLSCMLVTIDCRDSGVDCRDSGVDCRDSGVDCRDSGVDCRNSGADCRDSGVDYRDSGADYRDSGTDYRDSGADYRDSGADCRDSVADCRDSITLGLSAYVLQTLPSDWPTAIPDLIASLQPSSFPNIPSARLAWVLLQILTVLPEEFQSSHLAQNHKSAVRNELQKNIPIVLPLLESVLSTGVHESTYDMTRQAVVCASAWFQLGVALPDCDRLADNLVALVFQTGSLPHHLALGLCELILDTLSNMVTHPNTHKYPESCLQMLHKLLVLRQASVPFYQDLLSSVYTLFISLCESHSRLLLDTLLVDGASKRDILQVLQIILECSDSAGVYPTEETTSQLAFSYWFILQDDIIGSETQHYSLYVSMLSPVYRRLAEILLRKSMLPETDETGTADERELLRCYRQDAADTMMYCYNVLREDLLKLLHSKLEDALLKFDKDPSQWQPLESCLHAFLSVSECVQTSETDNLPKFLATLQKLPFQRLDVRVMSTVLDAIGAYAEWINGHPEVLTSVIPLLVMGLGTPQVAPSATLALKDLTRDCQNCMGPFAHHILQASQVTDCELLTHHILRASQDALRCNQLKLSECVRLMYTVGRVLAVLPMESIMNYLNQMLMPYVEELHVLVTLEINTVTKLAILSRLKMLSMLFATLDVQGEGDVSRFPQPVFLVLQRILPVIQAIVHVWCSDAQVIEFVIMYGRNKSHVKLMQSLMCELSSITLHLTTPPHCQNISEYSDILEAFFNLLAQVLKKNAELLASAESLELEKLFQCGKTAHSSLDRDSNLDLPVLSSLAQHDKRVSQLRHRGILALSVPEALTVKASSSFLVNFISQSTELAPLFSVVQSNGESLTLRILRNIGGESPRSALEPLADLLLTMNKKHCDSLSRWLHTTVCSEPQPLPRSTVSQRELFVKMVLRERANKRKLQETVREFSLICRGLVGTEYAGKLSPYF
uniref:Importin-13 n=1 Tax=Timema californicum TaxID=61474 RepID=A0A7R9J8M5_TIMCA|nr:unnamed protein product [Timema californicum]